MVSQRKPVTVCLRRMDEKSDIWAVDSDSGIFSIEKSILMDLGKIIERFLTMDKTSFEQSLVKAHIKADQPSMIEDDHHRFMKLNDQICLRSQIDCASIDEKTGKPFVFEIKTRSVCPMR